MNDATFANNAAAADDAEWWISQIFK